MNLLKEKFLASSKHRESSLRRSLEEAEQREERSKVANERRQTAMSKVLMQAQRFEERSMEEYRGHLRELSDKKMSFSQRSLF